MNNPDDRYIKQCCAGFYGNDLAHLLLGESFHPGGTPLTSRLGHLVQLTPRCKVLDIAAGRGTSAIHIAQAFSCEVVGIDLSEANVAQANELAALRHLSRQAGFLTADAETLPFSTLSFDAILCECALCTFPNKRAAAAEFSRVLKPGGRLGLSDLTRTAGPLPGLDGLLSWIACIADAKPVNEYVQILQEAGLTVLQVEDHSQALTELVHQIQGRLLIAEVAAGLKKINLPNASLSEAKELTHAALRAIADGKLGYSAVVAVKPV